MAPRSIAVQSQQNFDEHAAETHPAVAPVPAVLSCRRCGSRAFHAQLAESVNFLVLAILFAVEKLCCFANPKEFVVIDAT
jgi:hypothetical protein